MTPVHALVASAALTCILPMFVEAATLAAPFTDGAVLQREQRLPIWGTGRDGEVVEVELLGHVVSTVVAEGRWRVDLPPLPATRSTTLVLRGDTTVMLKDVAVGEVWILGGQSNLEWRLNQCAPLSDAILAAADDPAIRQAKVPHHVDPAAPLPAFGWRPFDKRSAGHFSAVGYHFAVALREGLGEDIVVGLLACTFGGTPIEAWMSREALVAAGEGALLDADGPPGKAQPTLLRATMLAPILPYGARGMLWYHGENNAGRKPAYAPMLRQFMATCRADWARPDWPILVGQLSSPTANWPDDADGFALLREAQRAVVADDPRSGLVVTLDRGERGNVHPIDKQPVGERFARLALSLVHGKDVGAPSSPMATAARRDADTIVVSFSPLPGKLEIRDPAVPTLEFGDDAGTWVAATTASVSPDGRSLLIPVPAGFDPKHVRYAWRNFCAMTLFTDEGLPVAPWSLAIETTFDRVLPRQ